MKIARFRFRPWVAIVAVNLIGLIAYATIHSFRAARERANVRACYSNQRSIVGSVEMYSLDKKLDMKTLTLDAALHARLKDGGYFRTDRPDPGQGPGSGSHYVLDPSAPCGIRCTVHGAVQPLK
jgi:hypothetical protein